LKVNHRNRTDFKKLGAIEFQPNPGKPQTESLYALPFRILDDTWRLRTWIRKSLNAARAAD